MAETIEWSNQMGSRGRAAWLLLVKDGQVTEFKGQSVPKLVAITGTDFKKNGKWSHTTYRLALAEGVKAISGRNGWETGRFSEGLKAATRMPCDSWEQVAAALGVTRTEAERFVREYATGTAEALDAAEAALNAL